MKNNKKIPKNRLLTRFNTILKQIARFILSRYFITLVIIVAELYLAEHLLYIIVENMLITTTAVFGLFVLGFIHLVNRETNPEYKVTWLAVMMIPFAGVLIYFLFFVNYL